MAKVSRAGGEVASIPPSLGESLDKSENILYSNFEEIQLENTSETLGQYF